MSLFKSRSLVLGVAFALGGCSFASEALFPSLEADEGVRPAPAAPAGPPALGDTNFVPPTITPGQPTGTFVGQKVQTLRGELTHLQDAIRQRNGALQALRDHTGADSRAYHQTIAGVNARLQLGTTPGNPVLQQQWRLAQQQLNQINADIAGMNQLAAQVASDNAMAAYLLESVRAAFTLSGAVEEDHRQLDILEDETSQTTVLIERLLSELSQDVSRQQSYVANERSNLNTLALGVKNGQMYGASLDSRAAARAPTVEERPFADIDSRRPLVVIRFDRPNVAYEPALYQAVSQALERRPNARFDLVAVAPGVGSPGQTALNASSVRRNAQKVMRSLTEMGLSADRMRFSALTNPTALSNEVRLYVR